MANTLLSILVSLGLDTSAYEKSLGDAEGKTKSSASKMGQSLSAVGSSMMKVGGIMTAAVTAPIVAGAYKSIQAASDLNETVSKVGIVFGDSAKEVLAFGDTAAKSLGMSKNEALSAAGTFGNLFVAMGLGQKPAADMSTSIVQLAGDLASFNNMDPSEVLEKLRAGLVGETEPLRMLGVNINQATIEAKAMALGLWDGTGAISAAAKAQASYALILEQTKTAQGDFARTSDGLANQTRILKAEFANASAELGTKLLPIALQLVQMLTQLITAFTSLPAPVQNTILVALGLLAVVGPLLIGIGSLISAIGTITTLLSGATVAAFGAAVAAAAPVIAIVAAIIAIVAGMIFVWKKNYDTMLETWKWVTTTFTPLWEALGRLFNSVIALAIRLVTDKWNELMNGALKPVADFVTNTLLPALKALGDWLGSTFGPIIQKAADFLKNVFGGAFDWVMDKIRALTDMINKLADMLDKLGKGGEGAETFNLDSAGAELSSGGGAGTTNIYNIFSSNAPGEITNALSLSRMMGGAA